MRNAADRQAPSPRDDLLDGETVDAGARRGAGWARRVRVSVVAGPDRGASLLLQGGGEAVLGSAPGADLLLHDRAVSRRHLLLRLQGSGVLATDLGSRNGTFHGSAQVRDLMLGGPARLRLGPHTEIDILPESDEAPAGRGAGRYGGVIGQSAAMQRLFALLDSVAASETSVLLLGETGTGKDALAEAIHRASPRRDGPLVVVDCGSLPRELAGAELFGHVRGAFTGAGEAKRGLIEAASGGTLFLDEIGELPMDLQPQLLRVLEKREIRPIGDTRSRPVDIRVLAATHRDLRRRIGEGLFRQDLYFRLAVVEAAVPPLRERLDDIPLLIDHFLRLCGQPDFHVSPALMVRFMSYAWPGNVRELRNVVQRCLSLRGAGDELAWLPGDSTQTGGALPPGDEAPEDAVAAPAGPGLPFKEAKAHLVAAFERDYLSQLLQRHQGNISRAAQEAGIDRNHIHRLLKRYGM